LGSRDFKKALTTALQAELRHVATLELADVVDAKLVHAWIDEWNIAAVEQKHLSDLVVAANEAVVDTLRDSGLAARDLLGPHSVKEIETLLFDNGELSEDAEGFVANLMQQDFTRQLFTEIVFTSIVSFNKKLNPLFGSFAMRAMEDQIKGFIRLFMPMLQTQAAAFAVENQDALIDLARKMLGEAWQRPLREYVRAPSAKRRAAAATLLHHAVASPSLEDLTRRAAHAAWDSIGAATKGRPLGEILQLAKHSETLATQAAEVLLPFLAHAPILDLIEAEIEIARATAAPAAATKARAPRATPRKRTAPPA